MKYLATALLLSFIVSSSSAQLTFTKSDYLSYMGGSNTETTYQSSDVTGLSTLIAKTGSGQTWDFSGRTYDAGTVGSNGTLLTYPGGAAMANDPDFITATHVIKTVGSGVTNYMFIRVTDAGSWMLGFSQDSMGVQSKVLSYSPGVQQLAFPLTMGTSWQSTSNINSPDIPPGGSFTESGATVVDGEGTLTVPGGGAYQALRVRSQTINSISFPPFFSKVDTTYSYQWYTKEGYTATITANAQGVPTKVSYSKPGGIITPPSSKGIAWLLGASGEFGTAEVGSIQPKTLTLVDTSSSEVTIQNAVISGTDASEFTVGTIFPQTLQTNGQLPVALVWSPVGNAGPRSAMLTLTFGTPEGDRTLTMNLTGTATAAQGGVLDHSVPSFELTVWPNPVSSTGSISLTSQTEGMVEWNVVDPLGRVEAVFPAVNVAAGAATSLALSPEALGLTSGVYYLNATINGATVTRQIVVAR